MKKRLFDIFMGSAALAVTAVPMAVIFAAVKLTTQEPALLKEERLGKDGNVFKIYKFRSLTDARDENGVLLPKDQRMTKTGKFIRRTCLDELPQIFNILKGDMSFVGPRPRLASPPDERHSIPPDFRGILDVRPGLTSALTIGRLNGSGYDDKSVLLEDLSYAKKPVSVWDDFMMVVGTLPAFLGRNPQEVDREKGNIIPFPEPHIQIIDNHFDIAA